MSFGYAVISDLYLFQGTFLWNFFIKFFRVLMLSFIDKVTTGTQNLVLFIWNNPLVVDVSGACVVGGTATGLAATSGELNISDIIQFFDHGQVKLSLIKGKLKFLQKLHKYFYEKTTSVSNVLLLADVLPFIFVL